MPLPPRAEGALRRGWTRESDRVTTGTVTAGTSRTPGVPGRSLLPWPELVWLDIKDPNYCGEAQNRGCSVAGLRDKAQRLRKPGRSTCAELKKGAGDRAAGQLAATLSWTATYNDPWYVDKLLGDAGVDGIIAGYGNFTGEHEYGNGWQCANTINLVRDWVNRHSATHRMATSGDRLFR